MASIELRGVNVTFPVYGANNRSLQGHLLGAAVGGIMGYDGRRHLHIEALRDISLSLARGDRLAVIGHNGAGKSTLLRAICGIFEPHSGTIEVSGRLSTLFDPALAMEPDSTGREYVVLRGLYLGFSRREVLRHLDDIASFSELGPYLSVPIRSYSAGMKLRLSFAASTWFEPDVLLFDEMIASVDASFLHKIENRLTTFVNKASIVVVASHSETLVRELCTTGVLLERGEIVIRGRIDEVLDAYRIRQEQQGG